MNHQKIIVLSIDDDEMMLELMEGILVNSEFKLYTSSDANKGIRLAKKVRPDIILLDVMMPHMNGFMVSKVLKRNLETKNIPIIFLTATNDLCSLYVVRPFRNFHTEN